MSHRSRHPAWVVLLLAQSVACVDLSAPSTDLGIAENKQKYVPQQGRLLEGFKTPDARRFDIAGATVVNTELIIGALAGKDVVQASPFTATYSGTPIEMRIAEVIPPDEFEPRWQYVLEQRNGSGEWEPACDAPPQLVPPNEPLPTPTRAVAMPGEWLSFILMAQPQKVTFACRTGVAAKCDGWGYSVTSQWPDHTKNGIANHSNGYDMMQACTQMARADYCGVGAPNTLDGTPIWINDAFAPDEVREGFAFEAAWAGRAFADGRPLAPTPVVCLSKLRWSTLPLGGDCPLRVPDPRVDGKGQFCDDLSPSDMERAGARIYSSSTYIDAGLYTFVDPTTQLHLTTASLLPAAQGHDPEWQIQPPAGVPFPLPAQPVALEATIFRAALPVEIPNTTLVPLTSYRCANDLATSTRTPDDPTCEPIALEGWIYPAGTPGRAPLRRWVHPATQHSTTTAVSPSTMLAQGWNLAEVVGGVLRAAIDVNVRWSALPGYNYTLDVQNRAGYWITSCIDSAQIGTAPRFVFRGECTNAGNYRINHADISAFRITYTQANQPSYTAMVDYDGFSSDAYIALDAPGSATTALALRWNNLGDRVKYALDIRMFHTDWIRCADENALGSEPSYLYTGRCWSAGMNASIRRIRQLRVCAIDSTSGQELGCSAPQFYNSRSPRVELEIKSAAM